MDIVQVTSQCTIDCSRRKIYCGGEEITLSSKIRGARPWKFLELLIESPGMVLTYNILDESDIWPDDMGRGIDHRSSLKTWVTEFNKAFGEKCIVCKTGYGYCFESEYINYQETVLRSNKPAIFNSYIIGRDDDVKKLKELLDSHRVVFVEGIDGIGKTTLIKLFIKQFEKQYDVIIYIRYTKSFVSVISDDNTISITNFCRKKDKTGCFETDEEYFKRKIAKLLEISTERTLLIFDDYNQEDDGLFDLVKVNAQFIFTTRRDFGPLDYGELKLNPICCEKHIKDLFFHYYTRQDINYNSIELLNLINYVQRHTLTVIILAKQMMINHRTPSEMLQLISLNMGKNMREKIRLNPMQKARPAFDFLREVLQLSTITMQEYEILNLLAYIAPSEISISKLYLWLADRSVFEKIEELRYHGLIESCSENDLISVHTVIKEIVLYENKYNLLHYNTFLRCFSFEYNTYEIYSLSLNEKRMYAEVSYNLLKYIDNIGDANLRFCIRATRLLGFDIYISESLELSKRIDEYLKSIDAAISFERAYIIYSKGWIYVTKKRDFKRGIDLYGRAINIIEKLSSINGDQKRFVSEIYADYGIALCRYQDGDGSQAKGLIDKAILIYKATMLNTEENYLRLSWLFAFRAECCIKEGTLHEAEEDISEAELLQNRYSGKKDIYYSNIQLRKSKLLFQKGQFQEALQVVLDGFQIYKKHFSYNTLSSLEHLIYIAELCVQNGNNDDALFYFASAMDVANKVLNDDDDLFKYLNGRIKDLSREEE